MFGKIYELNERTIRKRIQFLAAAFDIEKLLETPVRKLFTDQRMRMEYRAAFVNQVASMMLNNAVYFLLADITIHRGLRLYESGSAIQHQVKSK